MSNNIAPGSTGIACALHRVRGTSAVHLCAARLHLPFDELQLQLGDGFRRIETLRAGLGAVHDGVAAIEPERILEIVEPFAGRLVARVGDPAVGLQQRGRSQIALDVF